MTVAFVFPGQGSQSIGMMSALSALSPIVGRTFSEASEVLGYDLWQLCQQGPEALLNQTERTQPAMLTADVATYRLWRERGGVIPAVMAGHSLGEFSALVAAGCMDFKTAVEVVKFRGEAMAAAVPAGLGAMAAVLGLEDSDIEAVCRTAAHGQIVEPANFNAPGQVVIAGHATAVQRAMEEAKAHGAKRAILLPISVPCHSSLMRPAAERLRERLAGVSIAPCTLVKYYGVDVRTWEQPDDIRAALVKQLPTPVYWGATVRTMISAGVTRLVECGPGKVLTGLNRRIDKNRDLGMFAIEDPGSLHDLLAAASGWSS
jgi:[acyl-carrier-protein] S-malonyltransferase